MKELENGDLQLENGTIIPMEKRTRTEVYSRVVGYLRPIRQWNKGKQSEWKDRKVFIAPKIESGEGQEGSDA
jgi:ribonucleoside-triphosphate reductase